MYEMVSSQLNKKAHMHTKLSCQSVKESSDVHYGPGQSVKEISEVPSGVQLII